MPDSGYFLKVEQTGFPDNLDIGYKRNSRIKMGPRMCLSKWKDGGAIN